MYPETFRRTPEEELTSGRIWQQSTRLTGFHSEEGDHWSKSTDYCNPTQTSGNAGSGEQEVLADWRKKEGTVFSALVFRKLKADRTHSANTTINKIFTFRAKLLIGCIKILHYVTLKRLASGWMEQQMQHDGCSIHWFWSSSEAGRVTTGWR